MYVHHGKQVPLHSVPVTHNTTLNLVPQYVGQHCMDLLREELGPTNADMHVPLVKGLTLTNPNPNPEFGVRGVPCVGHVCLRKRWSALYCILF